VAAHFAYDYSSALTRFHIKTASKRLNLVRLDLMYRT
jgi:hypothetical protein